MVRKVQVIVLGAFGYWLLVFLLHKLFPIEDSSPRFLAILPAILAGPLLLGFVVSIIIKDSKGWIYGLICYLLYFVWVFIFNWIFELHFRGFVEHFINTMRVYLYLGLASTFFAALGGFIGDYVRRRK